MGLDDRVRWAERLGVIAPLRRRHDESAMAYELRRGARERALRAVDAGRMRAMLGCGCRTYGSRSRAHNTPLYLCKVLQDGPLTDTSSTSTPTTINSQPDNLLYESNAIVHTVELVT